MEKNKKGLRELKNQLRFVEKQIKLLHQSLRPLFKAVEVFEKNAGILKAEIRGLQKKKIEGEIKQLLTPAK